MSIVASCQTNIQARGKGKEVFSLSDEGPDADAEQGQSEGAESEAEEQGVHCGVTSVRAVAAAPVRLLFRRAGGGRKFFTLPRAAARSLRSPALE